MHAIIWEYQVRAEHVAKFEKSKGYIGTELLFNAEHTNRYITLDRWISSQVICIIPGRMEAAS